MALSLADFVNFCKRKSRYGDTSNNSDQAASDIIQSLNDRRKRFWRKWPWDWSLEPISVTLVVDQQDYTLDTAIGNIVILEAGGDDYLKQASLKRYYQWLKRGGETTGKPSHYVLIGRNTSKAIKLRLWKTPSETGTMTGFGKKRLTEYTTSDIATVTTMEFFPEETFDILKEGVLSDLAEINGEKDIAIVKNKSFEDMINLLIPEEALDQDKEETTPPPDRYIWAKRNRGNTTVTT